jgi:hypothetical protein
MSMEDEVRAALNEIENEYGWGKLGVTPRDAHVDRSLDAFRGLLMQMARRIDALETTKTPPDTSR